MNLRQLEQFLAVAETGSFSKGAARAHVSQPALSTAIGKLEDDLGVQLFNRLARQVTLTSEGHRLMASAKTIVGECETVRSALKQTAEREVLSIGICDTMDLPSLAATLEQFRRNHGFVRLKVWEDNSQTLINQLANGRQDIVFLADTGDENLPPSWEKHVLSTEHYVIATAQDHRLAEQKSAPLTTLHDLPFIARRHCEYRKVFGQLLSQQNIRPKVTYRTSQDQRALDLIRAGLGVGLFPKSLVSDDLHVLEVEDHELKRNLICCWKEPQSAGVSAFLEFTEISATS
ncbi:LysR family transcriptional regulator [Phaeobacter italicus]|jgi:DNA-binding transcriptional LysR family regulator|uniref:LysR family transcriptional regulator n=1 Tax=Roseobacteraceae TaxID=2854170 RepID=UPI001866FA76|nr:LysR family transcriptional regulator [Phycobacter azelaicus]MBE1297028.1 LysR family transcriptional regulator [Paracoccaceae bacterium]